MEPDTAQQLYTPGIRRCLRCRRWFGSTWRGNRICRDCREHNRSSAVGVRPEMLPLAVDIDVGEVKEIRNCTVPEGARGKFKP